MYQIPAFGLVSAEATHLNEPDSYDSEMSYVICDNPDKVPNDVTTALPSSSQDLNIPDSTISLINERIKNVLRENVLLKEKMEHGNSVMTQHLNSVSIWHSQVFQTHDKYRGMIKNLTEQNEKLKAENQELEKKLEDSKQTFVICQKSNNIGDSPCVEDTLLQNSDLQSQISDTICKFSGVQEKVDVENYKKLLDTEKELHDLQENHKFVQNEYYNSLSLISILEEEKKKLALIIREVEASMAKITQEKQDKDLMFKRTSEELEESKASQGKSDELRKQSSERLSEITITLADTQKKLQATEETVKELENTLKEMENLKASHQRSEEMRKESSEALTKVTATMTEVTATLTDNQKKLVAAEEAVKKLENELKLKEKELKAAEDAYQELTKRHTEKLEVLEVTQNKLVTAEDAAKSFNEIFETLESDALRYKEELERVQSSNRKNMTTIDDLSKILASYSEELENSNAECERHKENQKVAELTLVRLSKEQEQWKRVHDSVEREISDSEISSAWEQERISEGPQKEAALVNLIKVYQKQLEIMTTKFCDTQRALEEEQEKSSQLNTSIQEIVASSNETVNDLLEGSSHEAGASDYQSATVASTFSCPCCSRCFDDIFESQSHVEWCLDHREQADPA